MSDTPSPSISVEFAPFARRTGITLDALMQASDRLQQDLEQVPGFLGRLLLKESDDRWVDLVFWRSQQDADAAMQTFVPNSVACKAYFECMAQESSAEPNAGVKHFAHVKTYGGVSLGG